MEIDDIQQDIFEWQKNNFPNHHLKDMSKEELIREIERLQMALGVVEEAGELAHHVLKGSQRIRGGVNGTDLEKVEDAGGDIYIFLCQLFSMYGIKLNRAICRTASHVLSRDWKKDPKGVMHDTPSQ